MTNPTVSSAASRGQRSGAARRCAVIALWSAAGLLGCSSRAPRPHKVAQPHRPRGSWYTVRAGDTLTLVAQRYGVSLDDVEEINGLDRRDPLPVGHRIFLLRRSPGGGGGRTDRIGDGRSPTRRETDSALPLVGRVWVWPVRGGTISSRFGVREGRPHEGIDIAAPKGTPVRAASNGRVIYVGSGVKGYGKMIVIRHGANLVTVYAHNSRILVQEGQRVRYGQIIGEVGQTGRATGPHLHFELRFRETPRDPLRYVQPR